MAGRQRRGRRGSGGPRRSASDRIAWGPSTTGDCRWAATAHGHCCAGAAAAATHRHVMSCMASAVVSSYLCGSVGDDVVAAGGLPAVALVIVVMFAAMGVPAVARHVRALVVRALLAGICWSREFRAWRPTGADTPAVLVLMLRRGNGRGPG